jgi:hypothetical protein
MALELLRMEVIHMGAVVSVIHVSLNEKAI